MLVTQPDSIPSVVQQVAQGELTPQQAARRLVQQPSAATAPRQQSFAPAHDMGNDSLAELIDRLGPPPREIADAWCKQIRLWLSQSDDDLGVPDLSAIRIDAAGQLRVDGQIQDSQTPLPPTQPNPANPTSRDPRRIDQALELFRQRLSLVTPDFDQSDRLNQAADQGPTEKLQQVPTKSSGAPFRFAGLSVAAVLVGLVVAGAYWWHIRSPGRAGTRLAANARARVDGEIATAPANAEELALDDPLETLDQLTDPQSIQDASEEDFLNSQAKDLPAFSLKNLLPSIADPPGAESEPANAGVGDQPNPAHATESAGQSFQASRNTTNPPAEAAAASNAASGDVLGNQLSDPSEPPREIDQPTRPSDGGGVSLPPTHQSDRVILSETWPGGDAETDLRLAFPIDIPLAIQSSQPGRWAVVDQRGEKTVGHFELGPQGLSFAWTQQASGSSPARSLHLGQLVTKQSDAVYLRRAVVAEPLPIRLDTADTRPAWDLLAPLPPVVSRLSVDVMLPDDTEMTWVQPVPSDTPRRARGMAIIKPLDGESISLAIQFDIRCSRKLSCRIRYAARLSSAMPWQLVSSPSLQQLSDQLVVRQQAVDQEAQRLKAVYTLAGTQGKRILRVKQQFNDNLADQLQSFAQQVDQLRSLVASVESGGTIQLHVWIQWPDRQQVIFSNRAANDS